MGNSQRGCQAREGGTTTGEMGVRHRSETTAGDSGRAFAGVSGCGTADMRRHANAIWRQGGVELRQGSLPSQRDEECADGSACLRPSSQSADWKKKGGREGGREALSGTAGHAQKQET